MSLNDAQVVAIEDQLIKVYQISYKEIRAEILDHLACDIEREMEEGQSYSNAFTAIFTRWNTKLKTNTWGIYKGIPNFVQQQLAKDFNQTDWKIKLLSFFGIIPIIFLLVYWEIRIELFYFLLLFISWVGYRIVYYQIKGIKDYRIEFFNRQTQMMLGLSLSSIVLWIGLDLLWDDPAEIHVLSFFILYYFFSICYFQYNCLKNLKNRKIKIM